MASAMGLPVSLAPDSSARYSRFLDTPSCTSMAAMGSRISARRAMANPAPLFSLLLLNMDAQTAILVTYATRDAMVDATDITRISLFFTWESSWAITPSSSSSFRRLRICSVATTAAFLGLRPVAKALGMGMLEIPTSGMGSPALLARFSTIS